MTPQRMAIYEVLIDSDDHPCTEDVFERVRRFFPDIAIDTVYRTLTTFSEMGLTHIVEGYGEAKRYDPDTGPHHHFRCRYCNQIIDFQEPEFDNLKVPQTLKKKYTISNVKVVLEGICARCLKRHS
jgi:Fur family peroxide stress response transcriptional regulator